MDYVWHCASPAGPITMACNGDFLTGLWFDGQKKLLKLEGANNAV